jgi:glycoprotein endo-alpha-1,2-mannosidase
MRKLLLIIVLVLALPASARAAQGVAIFYYPWFGAPSLDGSYQHWTENNHAPPFDLGTAFYPMRGPYSSSSRAVLDRQMAEIAAAGVDEVVSSWWGWGSTEDQRLPAVVAAANAHGLEVAVHLEPYPGRSVATLEADVDHLKALGIYEFYVYEPRDLSPADWKELTSTESDVRIFAQTALPGFAAAGGFAGLYTYDILVYGGNTFARICAEARALHLLCAPSVGPGYDAVRATGDTRVKPRRNGATYDWMWRAALAAHADLVTITSYNEWNEGTQIEPAVTSPRPGYGTYSGTYGVRNRDAAFAYLARTAYWTGIAAGVAPARMSPLHPTASLPSRWPRVSGRI